jgi:hypothetical protein
METPIQFHLLGIVENKYIVGRASDDTYIIFLIERLGIISKPFQI